MNPGPTLQCGSGLHYSVDSRIQQIRNRFRQNVYAPYDQRTVNNSGYTRQWNCAQLLILCFSGEAVDGRVDWRTAVPHHHHSLLYRSCSSDSQHSPHCPLHSQTTQEIWERCHMCGFNAITYFCYVALALLVGCLKGNLVVEIIQWSQMNCIKDTRPVGHCWGWSSDACVLWMNTVTRQCSASRVVSVPGLQIWEPNWQKWSALGSGTLMVLTSFLIHFWLFGSVL